MPHQTPHTRLAGIYTKATAIHHITSVANTGGSLSCACRVLPILGCVVGAGVRSRWSLRSPPRGHSQTVAVVVRWQAKARWPSSLRMAAAVGEKRFCQSAERRTAD